MVVQHPTEDADDPLRIALEAHFEGLAYAGTAAGEKTLRSLDPDAFGSDSLPIHTMIEIAKRERYPVEIRDFARRFETEWWFGQVDGVCWPPIARDLRNGAAHRIYEKAPDGPAWRFTLAGRRAPILIEDFLGGYLASLQALEQLIGSAEQIAVPTEISS